MFQVTVGFSALNQGHSLSCTFTNCCERLNGTTKNFTCWVEILCWQKKTNKLCCQWINRLQYCIHAPHCFCYHHIKVNVVKWGESDSQENISWRRNLFSLSSDTISSHEPVLHYSWSGCTTLGWDCGKVFFACFDVEQVEHFEIQVKMCLLTLDRNHILPPTSQKYGCWQNKQQTVTEDVRPRLQRHVLTFSSLVVSFSPPSFLSSVSWLSSSLVSAGCSSTVAECLRSLEWCPSNARGWRCLWYGGSNLCRSNCWRATPPSSPPATETNRDVSSSVSVRHDMWPLFSHSCTEFTSKSHSSHLFCSISLIWNLF